MSESDWRYAHPLMNMRLKHNVAKCTLQWLGKKQNTKNCVYAELYPALWSQTET